MFQVLTHDQKAPAQTTTASTERSTVRISKNGLVDAGKEEAKPFIVPAILEAFQQIADLTDALELKTLDPMYIP